MANEIFYAGLGDLRMATILSQEMLLLAGDRGAWDIPVEYLGNFAHKGSSVVQVPIVGLDGYDKMAAINENATGANTALTDDSTNVTIGRQYIQRQMSDLASLTDSLGLNVTRLAQSMVGEGKKRLLEMIANVADDFTNFVGTTTVNMDTDDWFDAKFTLEQASVAGPFVCLLYPVQWTDLQNAIRSEVGPWQFIPATQDALRIKGPGYKGNLDGVDIYVSSLVPTANVGADSAGGMWGRGAIGYGDIFAATPVQGPGGVVYPAGTRIFVTFERDESGALTKIVGNYYAGVAKLQDSLGVSIITDR